MRVETGRGRATGNSGGLGPNFRGEGMSSHFRWGKNREGAELGAVRNWGSEGVCESGRARVEIARAISNFSRVRGCSWQGWWRREFGWVPKWKIQGDEG